MNSARKTTAAVPRTELHGCGRTMQMSAATSAGPITETNARRSRRNQSRKQRAAIAITPASGRNR
jgi:hypothetical protein